MPGVMSAVAVPIEFAHVAAGGSGAHEAPAKCRAPRAKQRAQATQRRSDEGEADGHARWRAIEVRHLAALAAVAHEGSFRRAADRLGYVQSAISSQIAHLERAAGTRLVERASGSSSVELTQAGTVLLGHTDEIITRIDAAYADVSSLSNRAEGMVRVAGLEHFAPRRLARVLRFFRERYPKARVLPIDGPTQERSLERLCAGELDVIVGELPLNEGPFSCVVFELDPYVLLVASDASLAEARRSPTLAEIACMRLIVPASIGPTARIDAQLRGLGITRRSSFRPESVATAQALVGAGLGEAIVPRSQVDPKYPATVAIDVPNLLPERRLALAFVPERPLSTAVHGFIRAVTVASEAERKIADAVAA
jgi:DNA-binding transcriptional LysR family regulator